MEVWSLCERRSRVLFGRSSGFPILFSRRKWLGMARPLIQLTLCSSRRAMRVDACAETRLRIVLRDEKQIRETALKTEGVAAVVKLPNNVCHLLAGLNADQYAAEMRAQLAA